MISIHPSNAAGEKAGGDFLTPRQPAALGLESAIKVFLVALTRGGSEELFAQAGLFRVSDVTGAEYLRRVRLRRGLVADSFFRAIEYFSRAGTALGVFFFLIFFS